MQTEMNARAAGSCSSPRIARTDSVTTAANGMRPHARAAKDRCSALSRKPLPSG